MDGGNVPTDGGNISMNGGNVPTDGSDIFAQGFLPQVQGRNLLAHDLCDRGQQTRVNPIWHRRISACRHGGIVA